MTPARANPFSTERIETILRFRPEWIGESWGAIESRLEGAGWRGAVTGPHGSGKTTFLEALAPRLRSRGFEVEMLFLNRQSRQIDESSYEVIDRDSIVLFDGSELLGPLGWRRFLHRRLRDRLCRWLLDSSGRHWYVLKLEGSSALQRFRRVT